MVSAKVTALRPGPAGASLATAVFEMQARRAGTTSVTAKTALNAGSSQHGKRAASVGGLELGGGDRVGRARRVLVGAPVESAQAVVQRAPEGQAQPPLPGSTGALERQARPLAGLVQGGGADRGAIRPRSSATDRMSSSAAFSDDLAHGLAHGHRHRLLAHEGGGLEIGLEAEVVPRRNDVRRQPIVHRCGSPLVTRRSRAGGASPAVAVTCRAGYQIGFGGMAALGPPRIAPRVRLRDGAGNHDPGAAARARAP